MKPESKMDGIALVGDSAAHLGASKEQGLLSMPHALRGPVAEFVKQHVNRALAPKPVTRADLWAHVMICLASYAFLLGVAEIDRRMSVTKHSFGRTAILCLLLLVTLWCISGGLAVVMRLQTREFRLSAILLSAVLTFSGLMLAAWVCPFIMFYVRPAWLAASCLEIMYIALSLFWIHWYVRNILPTTRLGMIRAVSLLIGLTLATVSMVTHRSQWFAEEEVPAMEVVPYAMLMGVAEPAELVISRALDDADGGSKPFAHIYRTRASAMRRRGDYAGAIKAATAAIEADSKDAASYAERANLYRENGDYIHAIDDLTINAELNPEASAKANFDKSQLWFLRHEVERAGNLALAAASNGDASSEALKWLGTLQYLRGDNEHALASWRSSLVKNRHDATAAIWIEIVNRRLGRPSELDQLWKNKHRREGREVAMRLFEVGPSREPASSDGLASTDCFELLMRAELRYASRNLAGAKEAFNDVLDTCHAPGTEQGLALWELDHLR